ncbi:Uu.00g077250.m01.CDS01 [Anthostomella pinea]|uniref:Uu.00g077250.m01.CDS01 n=1 Tax=Anthostomella pinea TaxID=933095 RepID=A0AAI8VWM2_9PEZI|nr:Uu.00g077250.m01.CDS01 [Anthostomella pinea]
MDTNEQQPEPTLPPAEQMRQRRLAKLANMTAASSSSRSADSNTTSEPSTSSPSAEPSKASSPNPENASRSQTPNRKITITPAPASANKPSAGNHFTQLGSRKKSTSGSNMSGDSGNSRNLKRPAAAVDTPRAAAPPSKKINIAKEERLEDWSNRVLGDIFQVTLEEHHTVNSQGARLTYLPDLKSELEQSGDPVKLTASTIDSAILEASRYVPETKALMGYLLPCWKRVMRANKPSRRPTEEKEAILHEAKRLCMSNCIFALTMPEYFGRDPNPSHDTLVPYLLRNHDNEDSVCLDFFSEAVSRMKEDDSIASIFTESMVQISQRLASLTMNDDYKPLVNCLVTYSRYPVLLDALAEHPCFQVQQTPGMTREQMALASENQTILGPFFRISPLQTEVTKTYFSSPRTIDKGHVRSSQTSLQMTLKAHQGDLTSIATAFAKASKESRNHLLNWFAYTMNANHKRRALQVKSADVASDGFMVNVTVILDQLFQPIMDTTFSKIHKVDIGYLQRDPRVNMSDETKVNADQATADAFYNVRLNGETNFVNDIFFLTLAAHHYGLGATQAKLKDLDKDIKYVEKVIKQMEDELPKLQNDPLRLAMAKREVQTAVNTVEKYIALKYAIQGVVTDQGIQATSLMFMRHVAVWLLRVATQTDYAPGKPISLPLPANQPASFSCLPEYALQDIVENFKFVFRYVPDILVSAVGDELIALCITFLRSSEYIKNPYLKSSLVTLLFSGTWPIYHLSRGVFGESLMGSDFANKHLLHSLMKFYIECEHSGVSSAFYDKFNIRYEIFQVIKAIWPNDVYRDNLSKESRVNRQFFVQFVNLLLNDATYLLDEALTKLVKIHDYQKQLQDPALSPEDREKARTDMEQAESQCQSWMQLVNDTMGMMKLFTDTLRDPFTMPEIVVRLAGMLNYNLETLVGPKRGQLKVEDAKKYHFDPKTLLSDFIDVYINLSSKATFIDAVASDGRSYKPTNFEAAARLLKNSLHKAPEVVAAWDSLRKQVAEAKQRLDQAELDLGDIPDEFEDPLMGELMNDPVILPSQNIVDRSTIVQQLLSNPLDPFTRAPMSIDDVVPADDLRARIEAWKAERIAAAKTKATGASLHSTMDTTEG